ncbi:MAG: hypothetical protein BWY94_01680 [Actinobacteria bacterium ADurb.BinA094]|nr:MAG: hypothetical protein BWY94_01680 [Actinobacteria bacterium ADurb.BinA094]
MRRDGQRPVARGRQLEHVGVAGRGAEIVPPGPAVQRTVEAVRLAGHELPAQRGEERPIRCVARGDGHRVWERLVFAGQPGRRHAPRAAPVGRAHDRALRRAVARRLDGPERVPHRTVRPVGRRDRQVIRGGKGGRGRPGRAAVQAAPDAAEARQIDRPVDGVAGRDGQLVDRVDPRDGVARPARARIGGPEDLIPAAEEHGTIRREGRRDRQRRAARDRGEHRPGLAAVGGTVERGLGEGGVDIAGEYGPVGRIGRRQPHRVEECIVARRVAGREPLPGDAAVGAAEDAVLGAREQGPVAVVGG